MANKKSEEKKKVKISFSVNEKLLDKFDEFLEENEIQKRSKYKAKERNSRIDDILN